MNSEPDIWNERVIKNNEQSEKKLVQASLEPSLSHNFIIEGERASQFHLLYKL